MPDKISLPEHHYFLLAVGRAGLLLFALVLASCASGSEESSDPYGLVADVEGTSPERTWVEPDFRKVTSLSRGDEYTLFEPSSVETGDSGNLYVTDAGDYKVKAFTEDGSYIATYGGGRGMGPGRVLTLTDVGMWQDSLVYIVDPRRRRVSFFRRNGTLARTEDYDFRFYRLAWADDSTAYMKQPPLIQNPFMGIRTSDRQLTISRQPLIDMEEAHSGGMLHTSRNRAVYVPRDLPVLLTYSPTDTSGTAHPTPDYGRPLPSGSRAFYAWSAEQGGVLSVQIPTLPAVDTLKFDLYDLNEMEYMHSVRFPIDERKSVYGYRTNTIASIQGDTTVTIYRVERPGQ